MMHRCIRRQCPYLSLNVASHFRTNGWLTIIMTFFSFTTFCCCFISTTFAFCSTLRAYGFPLCKSTQEAEMKANKGLRDITTHRLMANKFNFAKCPGTKRSNDFQIREIESVFRALCDSRGWKWRLTAVGGEREYRLALGLLTCTPSSRRCYSRRCSCGSTLLLLMVRKIGVNANSKQRNSDRRVDIAGGN